MSENWAIENSEHIDVVDLVPPQIVVRAGQKYVEGYALFFSRHMNDNTNELYSRAVRAFFKYLNEQGVSLEAVTAAHVLAYAKRRTDKRRASHLSLASIRPHLSALREFFNSCVLSGALTANPAAAVKPPSRRQKSGTTPVIDPAEVMQILNSIELSNQAAYRDRAMIATMAYCFYRISAILNFRMKDYVMRDGKPWLVAHEKGGKIHEMPIHEDLRPILESHIEQADLAHKPEAFLFPSSHGKSGKLNERQYSRNSAWEMVRRRAQGARVHKPIGNHSFRATGITTFMKSGSLEKAQMLAGHSHISTTKLYDRSDDSDKVTEIAKLSFN